MLRTFQRALLAALFVGLGTAASQAALIVGFEFADGSTNKVVPTTGGSYVVNIVATTNNPATTNIGVNAGYIGALSAVLNGSTIDGDITARALTPSLTTGVGVNQGTMADVNADGRGDIGFADGVAKSTAGWIRTGAGVEAALLGGPKGIIGTFTVTIPAYVGETGLDFLRYLPQLNPSGVGNDWSWSESNASTPLLSGGVGITPNAVLAGTSITFSSPVPIPEPSTFALGGVLALGLAGYGLRRKKQA